MSQISNLPGVSTSVDVLIVGAGPAGLAAAVSLRQAGVQNVVIVERQPEAGGMPRQCGHSPFGMREFHRILTGAQYVRRLVAAAEQAGARLLLKHTVVSIEAGPSALIASPDGLLEVRPRAILLATGVREAARSAMLVSGSRPPGIMNTAALQDMIYIRGMRPFRRPVIIGSELVAMSAILTCFKAGAKPVAIVEAGPRALARRPFGWLPAITRIPFYRDTEIAGIDGTDKVIAVHLRNRLTQDTHRLECDGVLFTGRFTPEAAVARIGGIAIDDGSQGPEIDNRGRTQLPGVYAAGNLLRGVETAGHCWSEGRRVANVIARDLKRLPPLSLTRIEAGRGVKYAVPQSIAFAGDNAAFSHIEVRLSDWIRGNLTVEQAGRTVWQRRLDSGPERRIRIPIDELPRTGADPLVISAQ